MTRHDATLETISLGDPGATNAQRVGAKAAGLARLRAGGFPVPDGVVLPVGLAAAWPSGPAPAELRETVTTSLEQLAGPVAVRSSATWEDGDRSAHAGSTATILDVSGTEDVLGAIRHCLDATAGAQADRGVEGDVAIVLQRLVPAEWAGVAFTADPLTGDRDVVRIAATPGLGEALVQGEVVGADVVVRGDQVSGDDAGFPAAVALQVAAAAREVETQEGHPQDVEWAFAGGELQLLQARPITVIPSQPKLPEGNNWQKDTAHYPEPMTPYGWSLMHACSDEIRQVFDELGLLVRGIEEAFVGGEIYGRVVPAFGSVDDARKAPPAAILGLAARVVPELRRRTATARAALDAGVMDGWVSAWHQTDRAAAQARGAELGAVDLASLDDAALMAQFEARMAFTKRGHQIHFRLMMPLFAALYRLQRLVSEELDWTDGEIIAMLSGNSPATRAPGEAMRDLADRVRAVPAAVRALETSPGRPVEALAAVDPALAAALEQWMAAHGWALINYDAGVPVLAERPTVLTKLLLAGGPDANAGDEADQAAAKARAALPTARRPEFDAALDAARALYPVREDNMVIVGDRPLALLRQWMQEAGNRLAARGVLPAAADAAYLFVDELAAAMAGHPAGHLADRVARRRNEEAWVRANPGPAYVGKQAPEPDISRLPAALRAVNEPILWAIGHEYPSPTPAGDDPSVLLAGVAVSPGVTEGPARIIRSHRDMARLLEGDVLVCQVTSPAWAPVFPLAAAVVADGGGVLSHAAIAAREHGLPAVLGTGDGTSTLKDGQLVRVDGTRGLVFAIQSP